MNTKRLILLARRLRVMADTKPEPLPGSRRKTARGFHLHAWFSNQHGPLKIDYAGRMCGTTACAFGEAVLMPEFKGTGLKRVYGGPRYKGKYGMDAASKFFGISYGNACRLFDPSTYPRENRGPMDVVKRIEELITRPQL